MEISTQQNHMTAYFRQLRCHLPTPVSAKDLASIDNLIFKSEDFADPREIAALTAEFALIPRPNASAEFVEYLRLALRMALHPLQSMKSEPADRASALHVLILGLLEDRTEEEMDQCVIAAIDHLSLDAATREPDDFDKRHTLWIPTHRGRISIDVIDLGTDDEGQPLFEYEVTHHVDRALFILVETEPTQEKAREAAKAAFTR